MRAAIQAVADELKDGGVSAEERNAAAIAKLESIASNIVREFGWLFPGSRKNSKGGEVQEAE